MCSLSWKAPNILQMKGLSTMRRMSRSDAAFSSMPICTSFFRATYTQNELGEPQILCFGALFITE